MNLSASVVLCALFKTAGLVTEPTDNLAWPCFVSHLPDAFPNNAICLYDPPANQEGREMRSGLNVEHPSVQIRIRAKEFIDGWQKMNALVAYINQVYNLRFDVGNYIYELQSISNGAPTPLGVENMSQKRRQIIVCNLALSMLEDVVFTAVDNFHTLVHGTLPVKLN